VRYCVNDHHLPTTRTKRPERGTFCRPVFVLRSTSSSRTYTDPYVCGSKCKYARVVLMFKTDWCVKTVRAALACYFIVSNDLDVEKANVRYRISFASVLRSIRLIRRVKRVSPRER